MEKPIPNLDEVGITNLGPIPPGLSFLQATYAARPLRKYHITPGHRSKRLTLCETMREVWRIANEMQGPEAEALKELAAAGYDYGKRMDARMKELKACLPS
jgi:hypothetical protein